MTTAWQNITQDDSLADAIDQAEEYSIKMAIFQSGLIPPEQRWLQLSAHHIYDQLSDRELTVLKMRTNQHTFPSIALALDISASSAKTYWRRAMDKCCQLSEYL